ncbi:MAG TPA: dephospho-CoA kinase [Bacteroidia bacterium]|nr:dephospho-CoA kinase [Bacteroidia bacterium]
MIVGLTGGIGTGKSTVGKLFQVLGVPVYNSDDRAKEMYFLPEVKEKVIALLGNEAYHADDSLNRAYISQKIFSDSSLLSKINSIIHPAVEKDFTSFKEEYKSHKYIVKETALLFETGLYKKVDKIILVMAPLEERLKRVMQRDKSSREDVLKRISHQMPDEEKQPISDFVIDNNETEGLIPQVLAIHQKLQNA